MSQRTPAYPIDSQFAARWSPRAYTGEAISDDELFTLFEAARWAPSGSNSQPWRFIYVKQGSAQWDTFVSFLSGNNQLWAPKAAALVLLLSKKTHVPAGETEARPARNHSFDAGAAWASLSLQGAQLGWRTRAMGGFDKDAARAVLGIPDDYHLEVVIAIGRQADAAILPDALREKEQPTPRKPLAELVADGHFAF
ncbi:malonic semialdehyde reductase RutE [Andreprevotia sp. IGB-42]|uniref:nitroreductase family protein n=1 Tax=Andreprevotia sp. IGB-42 TaxID=2497473 RepID=UPI001357397B|nr:nitroreductase family protein [Andreprevotia sp. IGB-42]KAF0815165.1 malonic semialdehyde reductase RutE [Andreprevotia sp. IGB-42]